MLYWITLLPVSLVGLVWPKREIEVKTAGKQRKKGLVLIVRHSQFLFCLLIIDLIILGTLRFFQKLTWLVFEGQHAISCHYTEVQKKFELQISPVCDPSPSAVFGNLVRFVRHAHWNCNLVLAPFVWFFLTVIFLFIAEKATRWLSDQNWLGNRSVKGNHFEGPIVVGELVSKYLEIKVHIRMAFLINWARSSGRLI